MDSRKHKPMIPIACRYIPYDRYFITHGDPAWKVKHLKQRILARALSLPIDTRRLDPDYVYVPPSTSVNRRKTGKAADKKRSKEGFSASGDDGDEPWNARKEGRDDKHTSRRAPSPITFAGAEADRDSDPGLASDYFSAASATSDGASERKRGRAASPSGSPSVSDEEVSRGEEAQKHENDGNDRMKPTTRRRGGSVSPIEFANPIVLRRQKSASMGAFLYEKGVEAGLVPPLPKSEKAKGKQKAKDLEGDGDGDGAVNTEGGDQEAGEGAGEGETEEEEAGYQVDDDDSEDWSDDYDDEDLGSYLKDSKDSKELPPEKPETPPPGGRILPGGDGTVVPPGGDGGRVGSGGAGVHFAAPATPRNGGKNKKKRKGASIVGPLSKIAKTVTGASSHQHSQSMSSSQSQPQRYSQQMVVYGPPPDPSEQILTLPFALMRFSTGQLLEDDLPISWYDLRPYELLEVHFVLQPRRFEVSVRLGAILTRTVRGAPFALGGGYMEIDDDRRRKHLKSLGADPFAQLALALEHERERDRPGDGLDSTNPLDVPPRPEMFFHTEVRELVSLPREDMDAYVKPYWEGWARALRVMAPAREFYQHQQGAGLGYVQAGQGRAGQGKHGYHHAYHGPGHTRAKYAAADLPGSTMTGGGGGAGMVVWDPAMNTYGEEKEREVEVDVDALRGRGRPASPRVGRPPPYHNQQQLGHEHAPGYSSAVNRPGKGKAKLEWRERWVVVRNGYIYLFKNRNDSSPTHQLALSALLDLRDAEHLAHHQNSKERRHREGHTPIPLPGKALSPERAQTSHGDERRKQHRRSTSTPRPSTSGAAIGTHDHRLGPTIPGSAGVPPLPHGRVLNPEEIEKKRKLDRDLEALSRWDDFGASFNFGKKEKGRDKERVKSSDKESEQHKLRERRSAGVVGDRDRTEGGRRRRSVDLPRNGTRQTQDDREWLAQEREREEAAKDSRTYIPASRDDAEAAGMKIICAKFRYRGSDPPVAQSKSKHWYTSTGPSLAGGPLPDPEPVESIRKEEQTIGPYSRQTPAQMTTLPQRAPTVPGRQMGLTTTVSSAPSLQSNTGRSETTAVGPVSTSSGSKFGLAGLFSKDKESDDPMVRREKEERKREEKERKAREKEQKQFEKDRKKEDKRRKDEDDREFRGISSSSSSNAWSLHPSQNNPSSISSLPTVRPSEGQSSTNVSSVTLRGDDASTTPKADQSRPQLKISPTSAQPNTWDEDLDDYDSDVSFSSPVFAHSTASSDEDDFALAKDRRGYRYGGYHAPAGRKRSVPNVATPNIKAEETPAGDRTNVTSGKAKEKEEPTKAIAQDGHKPLPVRPSSDNERGEWLVLDLGSDSAFTSLLRIFHRQNPSVPSSFLPHPVTATFTSHPDDKETESSRRESTPSSPITSQESGQEAPQDNLSGVDDENDSKPIHPEDLSAFMPRTSTRKVVSAPALPYPEWRTELVNYARFSGMREMERPLHLVYTAWGRDKKATNSGSNYPQRNRKPDSIWARRTRSSFVRTAERRQTADRPSETAVAKDFTASLAPQYVNGSEEDDQERQKRMSLASHVSTIKASKTSASREETAVDTVVSLPTAAADDPGMLVLDDVDTVSSPDASGDETDGEVILEVVSDEGFAYGRQDEEIAVAEALGWLSDDSDEDESEFEWAAWVTDLPRQHATSNQIESQRQRKVMPPTEQAQNEDPAPLSPMMFANPFVPDLAEPVMVYDTPRQSDPRPETPPPKDPEEERMRYIRKKRRSEPHATSVSEPLVHSHPNVSTATLHLHHSSPSTSTLNQTRMPSRASSSTQLSTQRSFNSHPTLSSQSSTDSLANSQRQLSARFQGRAPSLNINPRQSTRLRLQSNPTSPLDGSFSPTLSSTYERETSSQTFPRQRHQRQHSRSVSGSDSIFEGGAIVHDQEAQGHEHQSMSASRAGGLHHSASMPSTRIASTSSSVPRTPQTVTFSSSYDEYSRGTFLLEPSMENMPDDREPAEHQQANSLASSPTSRYSVSQSPRYHSGQPSPTSPRIAPAKSSNSVLKKRRSDLERAVDPESDVGAPLSPTLTQSESAFGTMQGNYPISRGPASGAFSSVGYSPSSGSTTPLDKAKALVRRVRSGSSLGGHEIQTVVEEHPQWEIETAGQQHDGQQGIASGNGTPHQPKKKKSAIDRLVRGFESSLDFMEGR